MNRYQAQGDEGQYEPGSNDQVLRNLVGITSAQDMDGLELELLARLYEQVLLKDLPDRALNAGDIQAWHRRWLGNVYPWAGQARSVNLSKDGFAFAAAGQIPRLLAEFERDCLGRWTPCHGMGEADLVEAVAITHVELILIHPFREGNGRLSRLLADAMAVQAGREPLDYSSWEVNKADYIGAIHQGFLSNYGPMKRCVEQAMGVAAHRFRPPA